MNINAINFLNPIENQSNLFNKINKNEETKGFGDFLKEELNKVNDKQIKSGTLTQKAVLGEVDNVHDVLIASEEAKLSLELTVQIRNKMVEAYQEINRMQI